MERLESLAKLMSVTNKNEATILKKKLLYYYCDTYNDKKMLAILQVNNYPFQKINGWFCDNVIA